MSNEFDVAAWQDRLARREARVGVIGLGYVGLPLVLAFHDVGFPVLGFDTDEAKIRKLDKGESYIRHIAEDAIAGLAGSDRFHGTTDVAELASADAILICVPTPLTRYRDPDLSYVEGTARAIAPHLRAGQIVILESTTYPGTTDEVLKPILESGGLTAGRDFLIAYSPEREDPGNPTYGTTEIPKVVGGDDSSATAIACSLYDTITSGGTVAVGSAATAEAVKLTENIFRAVNIALVNELKVVYDKMGIDIWEVIDAAKTKPFGFMPFYPGPGLGGHCIPIDPFYLTWKAREFETPTRFVELAGEINSAMPAHVVARLAEALNDRFGKGLNGSRVLMMGMAYKKDVDDIRESPSLKLMALLEERGADVSFYDPFIPVISTGREHAALSGRKSVTWQDVLAGDHDAAFIVTDHSDVDYQALVSASPLVVDTRNATRDVTKHRDRIVRA